MIDTDDEPEFHTVRYELHLPKDMRTEFTEEENRKLRPIAEVLALLDGNAFFTMTLGNGMEWYEQYLPEACCIYEQTGGWCDEVSWIKDLQHENDAVREAYESYRMLKALSRGD